MEADLIIANPPYGKIGANITDTTRENVEFDEYVNLLPANDYKRNKNKNLFNYQSNMIPIQKGFIDAAVTTHLAKIHKNKVNSLTLDEFERSQYVDRQLDKYFEELAKRKASYKIDYKPKLDKFKTITPETSIYINKRDATNEHLAYSKSCNAYLWNTNNTTVEYILENAAKSEQANGNAGDFTLIKFNTAVEKTNVSKFIYSPNGFRFISKLMKATNADSYISPEKYLPKVDWMHDWTVEEILAEYGYTEEEIREIMKDIENYRGLED